MILEILKIFCILISSINYLWKFYSSKNHIFFVKACFHLCVLRFTFFVWCTTDCFIMPAPSSVFTFLKIVNSRLFITIRMTKVLTLLNTTTTSCSKNQKLTVAFCFIKDWGLPDTFLFKHQLEITTKNMTLNQVNGAYTKNKSLRFFKSLNHISFGIGAQNNLYF